MTKDEVIALANELLAAEPKERHILAFAAAIEARVREECACVIEQEACGGSAFNSASKYMAKILRKGIKP